MRGRTPVRARLTLACSVVASVVALVQQAQPASAAASCTFNAGTETLAVGMSAGGDIASIVRAGGPAEIQLQTGSTHVPCGGGTPTVDNTDTINVTDTSVAGTTHFRIDLSGGSFAPGATSEFPSFPSEIEIHVNLAAGAPDRLRIDGGPGDDNFTLGSKAGTLGANLNAAAEQTGITDVDVTLAGVEEPEAHGSFGNATIDASGGDPFDAPFPTRLVLFALDGNDTLTGGDGPDSLQAFGGNDFLNGGVGDDQLINEAGNDTFVGGANRDVVRHDSAGTGVRVDLSNLGAQATGVGNDAFSGIEDLVGAQNQDDVLMGNNGPNTLDGGSSAGDDVLVGRGGANELVGGDGIDTASYEVGAFQGVQVDLGVAGAQDTGGGGLDTLTEIENLTGSPFADNLTGNNGPNTLTGLGATDNLTALGGPDTLQIRDGVKDNASCGDHADTVVADRQGIDVITADCELVQFAPPPAIAGTPAIDVLAPAVGALGAKPSTFAAAARGASVLAKAKVGTRVSYSLSEAATVTFTVERRKAGRRVSGKCRKRTRRNSRRRKCDLRLRGSFRHAGKAGRNGFRFSGRLRRRKLSPGRYNLVATARDTAGNVSKRKRTRFRIVAR